MALFTLLTDFGTQDSYVAEMKAAILARQPRAVIVDITHQVPAFAIEAGAFQLWRSHAHFPKGTWHIAIVDPGVGGERRPIYARTRDYHFVGPDNGLLRWAIRACEAREKKAAAVYEIPSPKGLRPTFHGRDLFAPFAAQQSAKPSTRLKKLSELAGRDFPIAQAHGVGWRGEIIAVDHYGNLVTSIPAGAEEIEVSVAGTKQRIAIASHYGAIPSGHAALIRGSHGLWEIATREASAATLLKAAVGTPVTFFARDSNNDR